MKITRLHPDTLLKHGSRIQTGVLSLVVAAVVVAGAYVVSHSFADTNQLYLSPSSGTVLQGNTVSVAIHEDSGTTGVNAVQANLSYDPAEFEFESIDASNSAFGVEAESTGGNGTVTIARGVTGGSAPLTGDQLVATVTFTALGSGVSGDINFASGSAVVSASDNTNIVQSTAGASFDLTAPATPTPTPTQTPAPTATPTPAPAPTPTATPTPAPASAGTIYLNPASGTITNGSDLIFDIHEDSGSTPVNAVQANYDYSTSDFQYVSISAANSDFAVEAQTSGDNGQIRIARGVTGGSAPLTGDHIVATVTLKAVTSGTAALTAASGSAIVSSDTNSNILSSQTGGSYTLTGGTGSSTSTTPAPTPKPSSPTPVSITGGSEPIPVSDTIQLSSPSLSSSAATTYTLDGQSVSGDTVDTSDLSDGDHTITATQTVNGKTTEVKQTISVHNKSAGSNPFTVVLGAAKPALPYIVVVVIVILLATAGFVFIRRGPTGI